VPNFFIAGSIRFWGGDGWIGLRGWLPAVKLTHSAQQTRKDKSPPPQRCHSFQRRGGDRQSTNKASQLGTFFPDSFLRFLFPLLRNTHTQTGTPQSINESVRYHNTTPKNKYSQGI
jgi:hypothetical protein